MHHGCPTNTLSRLPILRAENYAVITYCEGLCDNDWDDDLVGCPKKLARVRQDHSTRQSHALDGMPRCGAYSRALEEE